VSRVASIIQKSLGNLTSAGGGIVSGSLGGGSTLSNASISSMQLNATAGKILNKSPLELSDDSPTAHLRQNPYEYGTVYYPSDVSNLGTGHYMIFDVIMHQTSSFKSTTFSGNKIVPVDLRKLSKEDQKSFVRAQDIKKFGAASSRLSQPVSGINKNEPSHTYVSDTIILYTPPQVKTVYNVSYENAETGFAGGSGSVLTSFLNAGALTAYKDLAVQQATSLVSGIGDTTAVKQKTTGAAINPNTELVFKAVPFRDFSFTYEFAPRNAREVVSINKIINLFKFHMQPELGQTNFFVVPSEFQITYMYLENRNTYIPRISRCVLKTMEIDQSPEGVFSTFKADEKGAMPVYSKMSLTFTETEIMTKEKVSEGF